MDVLSLEEHIKELHWTLKKSHCDLLDLFEPRGGLYELPESLIEEYGLCADSLNDAISNLHKIKDNHHKILASDLIYQDEHIDKYKGHRVYEIVKILDYCNVVCDNILKDMYEKYQIKSINDFIDWRPEERIYMPSFNSISSEQYTMGDNYVKVWFTPNVYRGSFTNKFKENDERTDCFLNYRFAEHTPIGRDEDVIAAKRYVVRLLDYHLKMHENRKMEDDIYATKGPCLLHKVSRVRLARNNFDMLKALDELMALGDCVDDTLVEELLMEKTGSYYMLRKGEE